MDYLQQQYSQRKETIRKRLHEFSTVKEANNKRIFAELAFCVLTPQSNGKRCWQAIEKLVTSDLLYTGNANQIRKIIKTHARFHHTKAKHIVLNRKLFSGTDMKSLLETMTDMEKREWLVKNVKGFGYKEASHFLRNIGYWQDIAILDRHILKNLVKHGALKEIPKSLTPKMYLEIEKVMKDFSEKAQIPFPELDLLFWSEETGEVFK